MKFILHLTIEFFLSWRKAKVKKWTHSTENSLCNER